MRYRYYIIIMGLFFLAPLMGQDQTQALRYSEMYTYGSARYTAMGGAFSALGGDFTSASTNPAGLGLFRSSIFTITPTYTLNSSRSNYLGSENSDQATNFGLGNLGFVTTYNTGRNDGLVSTTLAFGYNTLNNFQSSTLMRAENENTSLLDNFAWYANNTNQLSEFYEGLAYETDLLPLDTIANEYYHDLEEPSVPSGYNGYGQQQTRIVEKSGYVGEYTMSAAMNISHQLYIGGTLGIHSVRFFEDIYHEEVDVNNITPNFDSFRFGEYNSTRGYGVALKAGIIFKPIQMLRIGAYFHAPVVYRLSDDKFTDLNAYFDSDAGIPDAYESSEVFSKDYTLRTPYRASLSAAVVIGKFAIASAEYEYVNYTTADLDSKGYKFVDENILISQDFKESHNLKAGAEIRLSNLYLRGGAQYYMNPYSDDRNGSDIFVYSGGIGFRSNQTSIDFSYALRTSTELYGLYQYAPEFSDGFEKSVNSFNRSTAMVTLGFKF